jgi:hypothetical protein
MPEISALHAILQPCLHDFKFPLLYVMKVAAGQHSSLTSGLLVGLCC